MSQVPVRYRPTLISRLLDGNLHLTVKNIFLQDSQRNVVLTRVVEHL
jgi:hypothetical protein